MAATRYIVVWRPAQDYTSVYDVVDTAGREGKCICTAADGDAAHLIREALNDGTADKLDEATAALARVHEVLARVDPEPRESWADYHVSPSGQELARKLQHQHIADQEPF